MSSTVNEEELQSKHQNVAGINISLKIKRIGKAVCMEYIVEKETSLFWKSGTFYLLSLCVLLVALSYDLNSLLGTSIFLFLSIALTYLLMWDVVQEGLLVTVPVGYQLTTTYKTGQKTTLFIPWHCVKDVHIIEAISIHRVLYNLVLLTDSKSVQQNPHTGSAKLVPLFQGTMPRLNCIETIFRSICNLVSKSSGGEYGE